MDNVKGLDNRIFPFDNINKKKLKMMRKINKKKGFFASFFDCFFKEKDPFKMHKKPNTLINTVNLLESLYVSFDKDLVYLLWKMPIYTPLEKNQLRNDLTYFLPQIV